MFVKRINTERMFNEIKHDYFKHLEIALSKSESNDGIYCKKVEEQLCELFDVNYACLTTSCSLALSQISLSYGLSPGDEVIVTPYACGGAIMPYAVIGCKLKFCDLNEYGIIDGKKLQDIITVNTKAVVSTGMWGISTDFDYFKETGLPIIGDIAQCTFAKYKGTPTAKLYKMSAISFGRQKEVPIFGTYGAILYHDESYKDILGATKFNGNRRGGRYFERLGFNGEPSEDKAVACYITLKNIDVWRARRISIAQHYNYLFDKYGIKYLTNPDYSTNSYQKYLVFVKNKELVRQKLLEEGIQAHAHYSENAAKNSVFGKSDNDYSQLEWFMNNTLSLPIDPWFTDQEIEYVASRLAKILEEHDLRL